eukprot:gene29829-36019_t
MLGSSVLRSLNLINRCNRSSSRGWARTLFVNTENTPNANSLKFLPGREVLPTIKGTGIYIQRHENKEVAKSPLAKELFKESGVKSLFFGRDFITVTKDENLQWNVLKPAIFSILFDFFAANKDVFVENQESVVSDTTILDGDSEVVQAIKELMETRVRPSVQEDGGDIFYHGFDPETGIVKVRLAGSCVGCPSSSVTLRNGVENMLMHYIPEVKGIEDVTGSEEGVAGEGQDTEAAKELKLSFQPNA